MTKLSMPLQLLFSMAFLTSCHGQTTSDKPRNNPVAMQSQTLENGVALIELFTSEGCSSCPSADRLVSKIAAEKAEQVYVVSYHVDYWDYLGWKDPFSQAAFSERQRSYVQKFSLESSYTPQVVVNGIDEFVGSDEEKLRSSIEKNGRLKPIIIEVKRTDETSIEILYNLAVTDAALFNIALVQPEAKTVVKRGENSGRTLHHINIVREFKVVEPGSGAGVVIMKIPSDLQKTSFRVIAFTQEKSGTKITGAVQTDVGFRQL